MALQIWNLHISTCNAIPLTPWVHEIISWVYDNVIITLKYDNVIISSYDNHKYNHGHMKLNRAKKKRKDTLAPVS